jgi:hypothetical protein
MLRRQLLFTMFTISTLVVAGSALAAQPAARVLEIKGKVVVKDADNKPRELATLDTVYVGEKIVLVADCSVTLAFPADAHIERASQPGEVVVGKKGCQPRSRVEAVEAPLPRRRVIVSAVKTLHPTAVSGATTVRGGAKDEADRPGPQVSPIPGSTVLAARPKFTWSAVPDATSYKLIVKLIVESGDEKLWASPTTAQTAMEYSGELALVPGSHYTWEVLAGFADGTYRHAYRGAFTLATDEQKAVATELQEVAVGPDLPYLTLAAAWYEENKLVPQAIVAFQRLVALRPNTAAYHFALARLYAQAGRTEDAEKAYKKAREIEPLPDKPPLPEWLHIKDYP